MLILSLLSLSIFFIFHGMCNLYWLLYAWQDPEQINKEKTPKHLATPALSFTALIPARDEAGVISQTIESINAIEYPQDLKEILVICRTDDLSTIKSVEAAIAYHKNPNIRLVTFSDFPINKPHGLNIGMLSAKNDVIAVFDAEDQPHSKIYAIANTLMAHHRLDVLQSGVQLMNHRSHWFSTLNVLEYFFWFKSTLHYFAKMQVIPLGGNTVFFNRQALIGIGGWDEQCLTEDADIGIRLSSHGARMGVTYDEKFVTQEETPSSAAHFIKQRTRWNQGFLEILLKGDWLKLRTTTQKLLSVYILITPYIQTVFFLFILFSLYAVFTIEFPIWLVLFLTIPLFLLIMQLLVFIIGQYLFCKAYNEPFYFWYPLKVCLSFVPYQVMLGMSATRAIWRSIARNNNWEKTPHLNAHRVQHDK